MLAVLRGRLAQLVLQVRHLPYKAQRELLDLRVQQVQRLWLPDLLVHKAFKAIQAQLVLQVLTRLLLALLVHKA